MMREHETRRRLLEGREQFMAGNFETAGDHLRAVLAQREGYADVHNMLGVIDYQEGRREEARRHFERALELNPRYAEAALHLGICLNEAGRYEESRTVVQRALGVGEGGPKTPGSAGARSRRGAEATGAEGTATLDAIARARIANLHADLGDHYRALGHPARAALQYQQALEIQPQYPDVRCKLGLAYRDAGELSRSLEALDELCERNPRYLTGRLELGVTLFALGRVEQARRHWQYVLDEDPEDRRAAFYLAAAGRGAA